MDNVYCYGTEKNLTSCRFDGWGIHDCERTEAAGIRCHERLPPTTPRPPTTTPRPKTPIEDTHPVLEVRVAGGRVPNEGQTDRQRISAPSIHIFAGLRYLDTYEE